MIKTGVLSFLLSDVVPDHCFVSPHSGDEVPSGPEVLPYEVAPSLAVGPSQVDRTLAFDIADHLCDRVFRWDRDHHVDMIGHEMALLDPAFLLCGQFAKHPPRCRLSSPYSVFLRHLGMKTTWYLHSHFVWLRLS